MRVHKYQIFPDDYFNLELPQGAKILSVQAQGSSKVCLWALVNPFAPTELRHFRLAGTGHEIIDAPALLGFIGTFQLHGSTLVFHLFELL